MQDLLIALLVGLILGWGIEWLIDWRYWRPTVANLRRENERLRQQIETRDEATATPPDTRAQADTPDAEAAPDRG